MHRLHFLSSYFRNPTPSHLALLAVLAIVAGCGVFLLSRVSPTTLVALGTGIEIFSGNWTTMGLSLPVDRILLAIGLLSMLLGGRRLLAARRLTVRPIHLLLLATATWATCSAIWAGTIGNHNGFYALLDRLGLAPFLAFVLAPYLFGTEAKRRLLLAVLSLVGGYLGFTALMEIAGVTHLIFPRYIANPNVGISFGRARGPLLDGAGNGIALMIGGTAAAIGTVTWRHRVVQGLCMLAAVLCALGILFTLTRAAWIGGGAGVVVGLVSYRPTRRYVLYVVLVGGLAAVMALGLVPGLRAKATARAQTASSIWDRYNTDRAALVAVEQNPIFGIGWQTFETKGPGYLRQAGSYPLTGVGLEVHNVFLSHAVELGVPGSILWTLALFGAVGGAILRRGPPELAAWRAGLLAIFVCFLVIANFGPLSYAFPNLVIWLLAGVVGTSYLSSPLVAPASAARRVLDPLPQVAEVSL